jgi:hypothetical protein
MEAWRDQMEKAEPAEASWKEGERFGEECLLDRGLGTRLGWLGFVLLIRISIRNMPGMPGTS